MKLSTRADVDAAEKVLRLSWIIVAGVILFSVFTVTPLVEASTPKGWKWSAPILPLVVDVAVVISIRVDAIVARMGGSTTGWPVALRVLTGGASIALNIGWSALKGDWVGVGVHTAAPVVLIVVAEASLKWRREIAKAAARIEAERREREDARRDEQREREERARTDREREQAARREERERQEADARERHREELADREREREHAARVAREEREHAARIEREAREHQARLAADERQAENEREALRLKAAADERREKAERDSREQQQRERERKAKEAAQVAQRVVQDRRAPEPARPALAPVSAAVSTPRPTVSATVSTPAHETTAPAKKLSESDARRAVADGVSAGRSQREIAALTGWSTGWVAARVKDLEGAAA